MTERRAWAAVGLLAVLLVVLRLPTVTVGLHMDDLAQRAMVEGAYPVARAPWDLYTFSSGEPAEVRTLVGAGALPWWSDPALRLSALRPLSSLTIWLDAVALGPVGAHVHSLLWWLAMLAVLGWALHPLLGARWTWLAVALYGLDDAHAYPLAWLANRAPLVSGVFGWWALGLLIRAPTKTPVLRVGVATALCMAGGEYGLCVLAYAYAYLGLLDSRPWRARVSAVLALTVPVLAYGVLHRGFGARHSDVYLDPTSDPTAYIGGVLERAPRLLADMLSGAPLLRFAGWSNVTMWAVASGLLITLLALVFVLHREPARRRVVLWALSASVVAVLPVCASFLSERLNVLASVGAHIGTAALLLAAVEHVADSTRRLRARRGLAMGLSVAVLVAHGWMPWWNGTAKTEGVRAFNAAGLRLAKTMPVGDEPDQRWVLLAVGDPMMLVYPPHLRSMTGHARPAGFAALCLAPGPLSMTRVSETALEITATAGWVRTPIERFFRAGDRPLPQGPVEVSPGLTAQVVVWEAETPRTVRFTFDRPLEDPSLRFLSVGARGVFRYPIARVGATMPLAAGVDAVRAAGP